MKRAGKLGLIATMVMATLLAGAPVLAFQPAASGSDGEVTQPSRYVMAYDSLDLEDHQGYSGEYIFGLTKGIMRSTMVGALKPIVLLVTVPLDIAFLPFAVIAGFFR